MFKFNIKTVFWCCLWLYFRLILKFACKKNLSKLLSLLVVHLKLRSFANFIKFTLKEHYFVKTKLQNYQRWQSWKKDVIFCHFDFFANFIKLTLKQHYFVKTKLANYQRQQSWKKDVNFIHFEFLTIS